MTVYVVEKGFSKDKALDVVAKVGKRLPNNRHTGSGRISIGS